MIDNLPSKTNVSSLGMDNDFRDNLATAIMRVGSDVVVDIVCV